METRRLGRLEHRSSVLIYGAASLGEVDQDTADASVAEALAAGINHVDVAAAYGEAELRLGAMMTDLRDRVFLATKTGLRTEEEAWRQINESLERLQTDHVDLLQLHEVGKLADLDRCTAEQGSLAAAVRARDEGLVGAIGITGHTHDAPATHLEALRRFPFDTVLTPLNRTLVRVPGYAEDYAALVEAVRAADVGLMTIKTVARRPWPTPEHRWATWYEPFDDQPHVTAAVAWVLDGHPEVTGIATAGETRLLRQAIRAEQERHDLAAGEAERVLDALPDTDYSSPFVGADA
ncbi:Aldo/keto reductase family protein [Nocardioides scoriae]|uniref:Aldo/keto reductase family protein n=1 Tax=Nocardioides scoriae TaxID=642780 RepID=A0A1H1QQQ4_9ACTN|nr:aldo/keto reductase [Nocardioides scoriae]SDS25735.1 Aldo/keto reductase family protein [Nocardioides scoriae]